MALEKTFWGSTRLTFLGFLIDTVQQFICIPTDKLVKALDMVEFFLNKRNKKFTVLQIQRLCGLLNFLSRCIIPGRAFTRRLYAITAGNVELKSHHHIRLKEENRLNLEVWRKFLLHLQAFARPFMDMCIVSADDIDMYSNASRNFCKGVGAYCESQWTYHAWEVNFMEKFQPSIKFLELYGVAVAVLLWIKKFQNRRVCLFTDNESVKHMLNNSSSSCKQYMVLIRLIVLEGLKWNVRIFGKHVTSKMNGES